MLSTALQALTPIGVGVRDVHEKCIDHAKSEYTLLSLLHVSGRLKIMSRISYMSSTSYLLQTRILGPTWSTDRLHRLPVCSWECNDIRRLFRVCAFE